MSQKTTQHTIVAIFKNSSNATNGTIPASPYSLIPKPRVAAGRIKSSKLRFVIVIDM
jgi:hypothetical protein